MAVCKTAEYITHLNITQLYSQLYNTAEIESITAEYKTAKYNAAEYNTAEYITEL